MSKFWLVNDVPAEDRSVIRQRQGPRVAIGPHAAAPYPGATEVDLSTMSEPELRRLKAKLEIHGADTSEVDAALAPIDEVDRDRNPVGNRLDRASPADIRALVKGANADQLRALLGHALVEMARLRREVRLLKDAR